MADTPRYIDRFRALADAGWHPQAIVAAIGPVTGAADDDDPVDLDAAGASAMDRIARETGGGDDAGDDDDDLAPDSYRGGDGPAGGDDPDLGGADDETGDDDELLGDIDFSQLPYREGKKLEQELKRNRERYRPFEQAFGDLPDDARNAVVQGLGSELGVVATTMAAMHPEDRRLILDTIQLSATEPDKAAERFANIAKVLRGEEVEPPVQEPPRQQGQREGRQAKPNDDEDVDDLDRPMTRREFLAQQERTRREAAEQASVNEVLDRARELGYDPDADDPLEAGRFDQLISVANRLPDGVDDPLSKAHEMLTEAYEKSLGEYGESKRADARRRGAAGPTRGKSPKQERKLETIEDAEQAADARIAAAFGPDRR